MSFGSARALPADVAASAALFASLFAAQAGVIAVTPVLAELGRDFDVSTAVAGQLRTVTGLTAAVVALTLGRLSGRVGLGRQLLAASALLALGSFASAAAPSFAFLALAQIPIGGAIGVFTTAAVLAAAEWFPAERRQAALSWALIGQPAAWIVGMPLVGVLGEESWRLGLALPLVAALVAGAALRGRAGEPPPPVAAGSLRAVLPQPGVARWLGAELLSNTAWAGVLVFSGALLVESYGASARAAGLGLAIGAAGYVVGNRLARELPESRSSLHLPGLAIALAVAVLSFGALRASFASSVALFAVSAFLAGARTFVSSSHGLSFPAHVRPAALGSRAAAMQLGYLGGSTLGGLALVAGGYAALGATLGALSLAAAAVLVLPLRRVIASARAHGVPPSRSGRGARQGLRRSDRGREGAGLARIAAPACESHGPA
jgi:predicted MFS family arabinose efflux permease